MTECHTPLDHPPFGPHYADNRIKKGMTEMTPESDGRSTRKPARHRSLRLMLALLVLGLVMLGSRVLALPNIGMAEMIIPMLGGLFVAIAIVMIVRRDRAERDSLPPSRRNSQDQGMPD
ncbi:hypothetical protein [Azospirillum ramasamyi]|uniref:Uncharacterized protein n=1 Tax=Azospirillum ramasamyi TaxID=682998 RepID=A0A2U9S3A3_9PROT|nr:hypothetical protein [Azospirillum ramasamyi]AWU94030.1 hypothetical protein DM194_07005 [Azospirillum ramasamyi]